MFTYTSVTMPDIERFYNPNSGSSAVTEATYHGLPYLSESFIHLCYDLGYRERPPQPRLYDVTAIIGEPKDISQYILAHDLNVRNILPFYRAEHIEEGFPLRISKFIFLPSWVSLYAAEHLYKFVQDYSGKIYKIALEDFYRQVVNPHERRKRILASWD